MKKFKFYNAPETNKRHFEKHEVTIDEIDEFFNENKYYAYKRQDGSYIARSKLKDGRYLEVAYRRIKKDMYFIITAYDIEDKEIIHALDDLLEK